MSSKGEEMVRERLRVHKRAGVNTLQINPVAFDLKLHYGVDLVSVGVAVGGRLTFSPIISTSRPANASTKKRKVSGSVMPKKASSE